MDIRNKNESLALKQETLGDLNVGANDQSTSEPQHSKLTKHQDGSKKPESGFDVKVFSTQGGRQTGMPNSATGGQSQRVPLTQY